MNPRADSRKLPSITKLEAARRQIDFAIEHHFAEGDPFVIEALEKWAKYLAELRDGDL